MKHSKKILLSKLGVAIVAMTSVQAFAQTESVARAPKLNPRLESNEKVFSLLGGLAAGFGGLSSNELPDARGRQLNAFALGSLYRTQFVHDLGLGWSTSKVSGDFFSGGNASITTYSGLAELSSRYRLGERFQVGPVANALMGINMDYKVNSLGGEKRTALFMAGLKAAYEMPVGGNDLRLTLRGMMDINLPSRTYYNALLGAEFSIFSVRPRAQEAESLAATRDEVVAPMAAPAPLKLDLNSKRVKFDFAKASIDPRSEALLKRVGSILAANPEKWESAEIVGHTDAIGSSDFNQKLSERRAREVLEVLIRSGVSRERLAASGFGSTRPVELGTQNAARAKNRRVELILKGVAQDAALIQELEAVGL